VESFEPREKSEKGSRGRMMNSQQKKINFCAFQYNQSIISDIQFICKPILDFGIKHFRYMKMFDDYKYLSLGTKLDYLQDYLLTINEPGSVFGVSQIYRDSVISDQDNGYFIWPTQHGEKTKDPLSVLLLKYDVWNGFTVSKRGSNYVETYSFATTANMPLSPNFYINNREIFDYFSLMFQNKAADFINRIPHHQLSHFAKSFDMGFQKPNTQENKWGGFLKTLSSVHSFTDKKVKFTHRELQCLVELSNGQTMKEIARAMAISPRTVESYLNSMKIKTGCFRKSQLLSLIPGNELYLLRKILKLM
jgi:DNA-binding CsgD family transcriptional regulator